MNQIHPEASYLIEHLIKVISYSLIPTLFTLYFTEKIKSKIKSNLDKEIEILKKDHSLEILKFQTEVNFLKNQENFKFTKLHEKRMEVLENIYKHLNNAQQQLNAYVTPIKQTPDGTTFEQHDYLLHDNFRKAHNLFASYYLDNKIYLDNEIENLIEEYLSETHQVYNDYAERHFLRTLGDYNPETFIKGALAYKKIPEKVTPIKIKIELKFKKLLGD